MEFNIQKKKQLEKEDKSDKGNVDDKIKKLCEKINSKKEYYTTSSCAGRVILLKAAEKKQKNLFLFRTHGKISFSQIKKELEKLEGKEKNLVYFKQEPCLLHVACSDIDNAQELLEKARFAGWKRSGMIATRKRVILELMSTEHLEFPIIEKGKILIDNNYLKIAIIEANTKLERTWEKIKKLEKQI